jgi:hypothetical protein
MRAPKSATLASALLDPSMAKLLYDNPLVATLLPCIAALLVVLLATRKAGFARAYGVGFGVAIAADAYLNGPWTFVRQGTAAATAISIFFVILGDFRYFVLIEHALGTKRPLLRAAGWAFVIPVAAQALRWIFPKLATDERSTYLVYELMFFVLACAIAFSRVRGKASRLARDATAFEIGQYALWALADIALMTTHNDAFFALRLVPNLMYYVAFVPFVLRLL